LKEKVENTAIELRLDLEKVTFWDFLEQEFSAVRMPSLSPNHTSKGNIVPVKDVWNGVDGRLRVRDINDAIRELGQMVAMHTGASSSTFTKLTVLQEAVRIITDLESRLRGMACHSGQ